MRHHGADFVQAFDEGEDFGKRVFQGVGWVEWVGWVRCKEEITACRGLYDSLLADDADVGKSSGQKVELAFPRPV